MTTSKTQYRAFLLLGLAMLFWAGNSIVGRAMADAIPPFTLAFLRWFGATLFVLPFAIRPLRDDWPKLVASWQSVLVLGVLGVGAFNTFLYSGLHYTTATNALLLQAAMPGLVMLLDRLVFGTRSGWLQLVGTMISMVGVIVIVFRGDPEAALRLQLGKGDLLIMGGVLVWTLYTVLLRTRPSVDGVSFVAATFFIGMVVTAPLAGWEWIAGLRMQWSWQVGATLLFVALLPSVAAYFIYNAAAANVGAARAGQAITLMPVFGAFLSAALLGEKLHDYHAFGIGSICVGIALGMLALHRQAPAEMPGGARAGAQLED